MAHSRRRFLAGLLTTCAVSPVGARTIAALLQPVAPAPKFATLYVRPDGANGAFKTLQAALTHASHSIQTADHVQIYLGTGTYDAPETPMIAVQAVSIAGSADLPVRYAA